MYPTPPHPPTKYEWSRLTEWQRTKLYLRFCLFLALNKASRFHKLIAFWWLNLSAGRELVKTKSNVSPAVLFAVMEHRSTATLEKVVNYIGKEQEPRKPSVCRKDETHSPKNNQTPSSDFETEMLSNLVKLSLSDLEDVLAFVRDLKSRHSSQKGS